MSQFLWAKYHDGKHTKESIGINAYAYARFENYRFFRSGAERDDCMLLVTRHGAAEVWHGKTMTRAERGSVRQAAAARPPRPWINCRRAIGVGVGLVMGVLLAGLRRGRRGST